jgi:hypothetical protein
VEKQRLAVDARESVYGLSADYTTRSASMTVVTTAA